MATIEAGRSRIVGLAVALISVWIGAGACAQKEQTPVLKSAALTVPDTTGTDTSKANREPLPGCFHYDGSEYVCPVDGRTLEQQRARLIESGTEILGGSLTIRTADGEKTYNLRIDQNKKLDAIFLTPRGLKLLEDHYELRPQKPGYAQKAERVRAYIASFNEPPLPGN